MAAYGFAGGLAQGLQSGLELGQNAKELEIKRQALLKEQVDQKIQQAQQMVQDGLKTYADMVSNAPYRTPQLEQASTAYLSHIEDTAKAVGALGPSGQVVSQNLIQTIQAVQSSVKTKNEAFTAEQEGKVKGAEDLYNKQFPQQAQPQPGPVAGQAPIAGPAPEAPSVGASTMPGANPQMAQVGQTPQETQLPWLQQQQAPTGLGAPAEAAPAPAPTPAIPAQASPEQQPPQVPGAGGDIVSQVSMGQLPASDVELLMTDPSIQGRFEQTYGVSAAPLFAAPSEPGSGPMSKEDFITMQTGGKFTPEREAMAQTKAKEFPKARAAYNDAVNTIRENFQQRTLIKKGLFAGIGSDWRLWAAQAAAQASGDKELAAKVANTNAFLNIARQKAGKIIKQFGAGTGLSDNDLKFSMQLAAGDISMNEESLIALLDASTRETLGAMRSPGSDQGFNVGVLRARAAQAGVDPDTIDRALQAIGEQ